ncbi:MAG: ROK family protein [Bacteroidales bacterium]
MIVIGLDIGGTYIKAGLVEDGRPVETDSIYVDDNTNFDAVVPILTKEVTRLLTSCRVGTDKLKGIGIAFPGLVNLTQTSVIETHKYYGAKDFDFQQWAKDNWGVPIVLLNDARMAGYGEWFAGAGINSKNMAMLTFGTGIGSCVIMDGKMLDGKGHKAGNLAGHFIVDVNGERCQCGNIGCAEAQASSWQLPRLVSQDPDFRYSIFANGESVNFEKLFGLYRKDNPLAIRVLTYCLNIWSATIINMIHAFDPELIILGGGVMKSADIIVPYIQERVDKYSWSTPERTKIKAAKLGNDASIVGAYFFMSENLKNKHIKYQTQ